MTISFSTQDGYILASLSIVFVARMLVSILSLVKDANLTPDERKWRIKVIVLVDSGILAGTAILLLLTSF